MYFLCFIHGVCRYLRGTFGYNGINYDSNYSINSAINGSIRTTGVVSSVLRRVITNIEELIKVNKESNIDNSSNSSNINSSSCIAADLCTTDFLRMINICLAVFSFLLYRACRSKVSGSR